MMKESAKILKGLPRCQLLWASSREVINVIQAQECGCLIITVTGDILKKLSMLGKNLNELSLDTVKTFYDDGRKPGSLFNVIPPLGGGIRLPGCHPSGDMTTRTNHRYEI